MSIVVLIGIPAAIRDAEHLVLWWRFDLVVFFFFFFKGCEDNLPLEAGFLELSGFGIYFSHTRPRAFPEGSCH